MASDEKSSQNTTENVSFDTRQSPPKAVVDSSPLQPAINKNKEALKIKLMVRRPIAQLVDQGIIPPLKSSPALYEQRKQLERAKTGDILKAKIQQRPGREELERRHILEHDEGHVDPSLAERQRMLKKARLADQLNSQLSHRPGPLELIKKNILHTEEPIERIVKEGLITFKATSEGLLNRPQHPNGYVSYEDDSQSSDGDPRNSPSASQDTNSSTPAENEAQETNFQAPDEAQMVVALAPNVATFISPVPAAIVTTTSTETFQVKPETTTLFAELCQSVVDNSTALKFSPTTTKSTSVASPSTSTRPASQPLSSRIPGNNKADSLGKEKNRKKNKLKPITKARTIKFHEYKGPPNAQKNGSSSLLSAEETSYQLLLKQQTCLLEYLEGLHKNQTAAMSSRASEVSSFTLQPSSSLSPSMSTIPASPLSTMNDTIGLELSKLEKMKVSDLKMLLKTRNLPVSGPKPQLIERLRPFIQNESGDSQALNGDEDVGSNSPRSTCADGNNVEMQEVSAITRLAPMSNEELLREQQRKIDELQRKLEQSQQELQQMQQRKHQAIILEQTAAKSTVPLTPIPAIKTEMLNQKQIVKQQLEAKIQKDKQQKLEQKQKQLLEQQQQQHKKLNVAKKATEIMQCTPEPQKAFIVQPPETHTKGLITTTLPVTSTAPQPMDVGKSGSEIIWNGEPTLLVVNFPDDKKYLLSNNVMPNILVPITTPGMDTIMKKVSLNHRPTTTPLKLQPTQLTHMNVMAQPQQNPFNPPKYIVNKSCGALSSPKKEMNVFCNGSTISKPNQANNFSGINSNLMLNSSNGGNVLSPMQHSNCDESTNYDMLMAHAMHSNDVKPSTLPSDQRMSEKIALNSCNDNIDFELLELLGQQLDMDITDDSCHPMNDDKMFNVPSNNCNPTLNNYTPSMSSMSCRRDMNPSLQPSLSELIQQQQSATGSSNAVSNVNSPSDSMNMNNNNLNDYNSPFYLDNGISSSTNNSLNLGSMDIEYFDNSLAHFDFSVPCSNQSNSLLPDTAQNQSQQSAFDQNQMPSNNAASLSDVERMQCYSSADESNANASSTSSQANMLNLFNLNDFKMTNDSMPWGEIDYAV